jgi:hypothetical protein
MTNSLVVLMLSSMFWFKFDMLLVDVAYLTSLKTSIMLHDVDQQVVVCFD